MFDAFAEEQAQVNPQGSEQGNESLPTGKQSQNNQESRDTVGITGEEQDIQGKDLNVTGNNSGNTTGISGKKNKIVLGDINVVGGRK